MPRARVPSIAWLLSAGFAVALLVLAILRIAGPGHAEFFHDGDSDFFLRTARSMFGDGSSFGGAGAGETSYRYGRFGFPFLGWLLAAGRPALVSWSLIVVYLASLAAIPGIAATLVSDYGAPPARAAWVMITPGILLMTGLVYAEALQIALVLLACVFEARGRRRAALLTIAYAILVKETSVLALVPWLWSAGKQRDRRQFAAALSTVLPFALWALWVRIRIGEFPFLAHTYSRSGALRLPGVGFHDALVSRSPNHSFIVAVSLATFVLGVGASWAARRYWIAPITAAFSMLILLYGPSALYYVLENLRLLSLPTVLAIVCLVVAFSEHAAPLRADGGRPATRTDVR